MDHYAGEGNPGGFYINLIPAGDRAILPAMIHIHDEVFWDGIGVDICVGKDCERGPWF